MTVEQYDILIEEAYQKREEIWKKLQHIQLELNDITKELDLSINELEWLKLRRDRAIERGGDDEH